MAERPLIAIVDDDPSVRNATSDLLRASGFSPAAFEDAETFLAWAGRAGACLIADMHMPGMSGLELYRALIAAGEFIPTVIITGAPGRADAVALARSGHRLIPEQAVRH